ncbi:MAG TPA: hypothetical protein VH660_01060, partial [Candidatus Deferrimicrobiaceae bacterium]
MNDTKNGDKDPRPAEGSELRKSRSAREVSIGLLSAAVFAVLFYLWGEELNPLGAGRLGGIFPFVGAVALTLAVALFLTEWFRFAGREVRKVRLAARDFLFLCTLSFALFFLAKGVVEVLPQLPSWNRALPARLFVYLIPL